METEDPVDNNEEFMDLEMEEPIDKDDMGQTESAGSQQDTVSTGSLSEETQDQTTQIANKIWKVNRMTYEM